jgi:hypothetical protein
MAKFSIQVGPGHVFTKRHRHSKFTSAPPVALDEDERVGNHTNRNVFCMENSLR